MQEIKKDKEYIKKVHAEIHKSTLEVLSVLSRNNLVYTLQGNVGIPTKKEVNEEFGKYGVKVSCTRDKINSMKKVFLVKNRLRLINGLRVGFLEHFLDVSWVKEFKPKDYQKQMKKAKKQTEKAKKILKRFGKLDILVCHAPPYRILDKVSSKYSPPKQWIGKHAGSETVLNYIKKYKPSYVLCGHIHEGKGRAKIGKTQVINAGCCGDYFVINV